MMNSKRTDNTVSINRNKITKNWLIGFVSLVINGKLYFPLITKDKGEGSYSNNTLTKYVIFSIAQKGNGVLLKR